MRCGRYLLPLALLAAQLSSAFDSDAWEAMRRDYAVDAERLHRQYSNQCALVTMPADDVKLPVELYADGTVRTQLMAKRAQLFLGSGFIWGEQVTLAQFRPDGALETRLDAEGCLVDRGSRSCWIEGKVRAEREGTVLEGRDAYFSASNTYLRIVHDTKITSKDFKLKGIKL